MQIGLKEGLCGTYIWYMEACNRVKILHCKTSFEDEGIRKHLDYLELKLSVQDFQLPRKSTMCQIFLEQGRSIEHQIIENYTHYDQVVLSYLDNDIFFSG